MPDVGGAEEGGVMKGWGDGGSEEGWKEREPKKRSERGVAALKRPSYTIQDGARGTVSPTHHHGNAGRTG